MPFTRAKQRRIYKALLLNIEDWQEQLVTIESFAIPTNKARILHLMMDIERARRVLEHMIGNIDEPDV